MLHFAEGAAYAIGVLSREYAQRGSLATLFNYAPTNVPNSPNSVPAVIEARLRQGKALNTRIL